MPSLYLCHTCIFNDSGCARVHLLLEVNEPNQTAPEGRWSEQPVAPELQDVQIDIPIDQLAADVQEVLNGEGEALLQQLIQVGGSPQGARPKALIYRDPRDGTFTTAALPGFEAWLVKFPAQHEHSEVCAIEMVYAECLRLCGIQTPDTLHFNLPKGMAAFASKRFDRHDGLRVPMQSLAAFTGADYTNPGVLDYVNFLRATHMCTNDVREKGLAFERAEWLPSDGRDGGGSGN